MTDDLIKRARRYIDGCNPDKDYDLVEELADALEAALESVEKLRGVLQLANKINQQRGERIAALQSQMEAAERDAMRYRKVRATHLQTAPDAWIRTGDDLDDAADAISDAVLAQEQKREPTA